jgi:hypothetical protein
MQQEGKDGKREKGSGKRGKPKRKKTDQIERKR